MANTLGSKKALLEPELAPRNWTQVLAGARGSHVRAASGDATLSKPEMSAFEITNKLIEAYNSHEYHFVCLNFANADMIGHTGNFIATIKACQVIDQCLARIVHMCNEKKIDLIMKSDHSNAEDMEDNDIAKKLIVSMMLQ